MADDSQPPEIIEVEITDTLDLHSFAPSEVSSVVESFLEAAIDKGFDHLRIIHGKGIGVQRQRVRSLLSKHPSVVSFSDSTGDPSGWGATTVILKTHIGPD